VHPRRAGQARRVTAANRREMKRRAAVEPVIGHLKAEHRMGRNYLKGPDGDRINAMLAAVGYNFSLLLRWLAEILRACILALARAIQTARAARQSLSRDSSRATSQVARQHHSAEPVHLNPCSINQLGFGRS
jgi:hypothetical protein